MFLTCFKQFVINRFYDVIDFCHNNSLSAIPTPDDSGLKKESVELHRIFSFDCNATFGLNHTSETYTNG